MACLHILYVEDNRELRETMAMVLEAPGRDITCCDCAESAWSQAQSRNYDVLISDVDLPGLSGLDLARRMVAKNPGQWVVLCTGLALDMHPPGLGARFTALRKPFDPEALERVLQRVVASRNDPLPA